MGFLVTSISGFLALFAILFTLALPYVLRNIKGHSATAAVRWPRMRLHYCSGFTVLALVVVHMYASMSFGGMRRTNALGLDLAALALLLVLMQVMVGVNLQGAKGARPSRLRSLHFAIMLGIVVLTVAHLLLNSALLQSLLGS